MELSCGTFSDPDIELVAIDGKGLWSRSPSCPVLAVSMAPPSLPWCTAKPAVGAVWVIHSMCPKLKYKKRRANKRVRSCAHLYRLERSVVSQALRTFCVFWRRGWAAETEEAKLSLFALLQQGASEGGAAAVSYPPVPPALGSFPGGPDGWLPQYTFPLNCLILSLIVFSFFTVPLCPSVFLSVGVSVALC